MDEALGTLWWDTRVLGALKCTVAAEQRVTYADLIGLRRATAYVYTALLALVPLGANSRRS
jgi:hypothetical protein